MKPATIRRAVLAPTIVIAASVSIPTLTSSCASLGGSATPRPRGSDEEIVVASVEEVLFNEDLMEPGSDPPAVPPWWTTARLEVIAPERLAGAEILVHFDRSWPAVGGEELAIGDRLTFTLPEDGPARVVWSGELDGLERLPRVPAPAEAEARAPAEPALRRFVGLERLYFERLDDPAAAGGGVAPYLVDELRRLLPPTLPDGAEPEPEPRVVTELDGPINSGLELRDFPLPGPPSGSGSFLRQVTDGTHPRLQDQYWAIYTGGVRTDLWFFATFDLERVEDPSNGAKVLAPLGVEKILPQPDGGVVLRVSGWVSRPMGAGWLWGTDLVFTLDGDELRYRYAVRRYSFGLGHDEGRRNGRVGVEELRYAASDEPILIRRTYDGVLFPYRSAACGFDVANHLFPQGGFDRLAEIADCITAWPGTETARRTPGTPSFLERGWQPEDPEPRGRAVTAVVVLLEHESHQERSEDGSEVLSDVVWLSPVDPGGLAGQIPVLCDGHPHVAGRPLELGDRLTFVLPPEWPSYDLWFDRLGDVAFAGESGAGQRARPDESDAPASRGP